jgi:hypothetical protein
VLAVDGHGVGLLAGCWRWRHSAEGTNARDYITGLYARPCSWP